MHIQQKFLIPPQLENKLTLTIKKLGGVFSRSLLMRDYIFTPDSRAYNGPFIERFALTPRTKGLFLRLREDNNLSSGTVSQSLSLFAYQLGAHYTMDEQIKAIFSSHDNRTKDILRLLELMGMEKVIEVTKKREEYNLPQLGQPFTVTIDTVEKINGSFMEIHCFLEKDETPRVVEKLNDLTKLLEFNSRDVLKEPYFQQLLKQSV